MARLVPTDINDKNLAQAKGWLKVVVGWVEERNPTIMIAQNCVLIV